MFLTKEPYGNYYVLTAEIKKIFGKKTHFLETGLGFDFSTLYLMFRIGYRAELFDHLLLRVGYTPYLLIDETRFYSINRMSFHNSFSVSIGYRFGGEKFQTNWDNNWDWLSALQFNVQPFFSHFAGYGGFYFTIGPEFKVFDTGENLAVKPWIAYAYGPVSYSLEGLSTGVRMVYGKKHHFAEAGMGTVWFPVNGQYSGNYFILQPEIGYRIRFWKRLMARIAYAPYWWLSDKKGKENVEKKFVNSVTVGVGYLLH
jgi:hypothetical protein